MTRPTRIARVAEYVGMSRDELVAAMRSAETCPLCRETGTAERPHSRRACMNVLDVWADRAGI